MRKSGLCNIFHQNSQKHIPKKAFKKESVESFHEFLQEDAKKNPQNTEINNLIQQMTSYDPNNRPIIQEVNKALETIA